MLFILGTFNNWLSHPSACTPIESEWLHYILSLKLKACHVQFNVVSIIIPIKQNFSICVMNWVNICPNKLPSTKRKEKTKKNQKNEIESALKCSNKSKNMERPSLEKKNKNNVCLGMESMLPTNLGLFIKFQVLSSIGPFCLPQINNVIDVLLF